VEVLPQACLLILEAAGHQFLGQVLGTWVISEIKNSFAPRNATIYSILPTEAELNHGLPMIPLADLNANLTGLATVSTTFLGGIAIGQSIPAMLVLGSRQSLSLILGPVIGGLLLGLSGIWLATSASNATHEGKLRWISSNVARILTSPAANISDRLTPFVQQIMQICRNELLPQHSGEILSDVELEKRIEINWGIPTSRLRKELES
jgi:hypothetical protein